MSKDNDDLINELNDFENGLRDVEKNKPQPSNHDSDGLENNDLYFFVFFYTVLL